MLKGGYRARVPANRSGVDREAKRAELVAVARRLFLADGYEATSMSALAGAAGVAGNTVYWYFADKDAVLVAVLDAVLADALADFEPVSAAPLAEQVTWVVGTLQRLSRLVATVHTRAARSDSVREWHDGFHATAESLLRAALQREGLDGPDVDAEVRIAVFTVEGLLTHTLSEDDQRAVCDRLARQWTHPS